MTPSRLVRLFLYSALPLLLLSAPLLAQETGTIQGAVTGPDERPLVGAQVMVEGTALGTLTNPEGRFTIERVPAGTHVVRVRFIGMRPGLQEVTVGSGETVTADFTLTVDALDMEELVVTGTRAPERKIESSTAITTVSAPMIREREPRSTADLVKVVPGFYVESSGGEVGGNLFARGLPADGSFRYVALMEEGMPVYDATELFFVNADIFMRVDETIDRVEAVRGGNSALFGSNAPGGVINFLSKTGGPEVAGSLRGSVGFDGMTRYDLNVGGPLADDWRFNVGGFYRFDDGIRDPGFPASRGGQIKANLTRLLENGHIRVYGRYLDDRNIFFLPVPIQGEFGADGQPTGHDFPAGFPSDGTMTSREGVGVRVPLPRNNGDLFLPLDDGQRQQGTWLLADVSLDVAEDWTVQNTLRWMDVAHSWNALLPFDLVDANTWAQGVVDATPEGASFDLLCTNVRDAGGNKVPWGSASCPSANNLLSLGGQWLVEKPMTNLSNQFQVMHRIRGDQMEHDLVAGAYFGHYTANQTWFFNDVLTDVRNQPRFLDVVVRDAGGEVVREATADGFRSYLPLYVNGRGNVTLFSFYAGDQIRLNDRWRIDLGGRFERNVYEQDVENTAAFDLDGPTDAHSGVNFGTGTFQRVDVDFNEWAASVGVNYMLDEQTAVYVRGSRGYKMIILDQYLFATDPTAEDFPDEPEELWQAEGGLKLGSPRLGLSAVGYVLFIRNFPSQDARVDPETGQTEFVTVFAGEARTLGAEVEVVAQPVDNFRINAMVTAQDPKYTDLVEDGEDLSGNRVRRIPRIIWDLTGEYRYEGFSARANWNFVGHRFSNNANTIDLLEFGVVNAGASYRFLPGVTISGAVLNLLDGSGLTEGNPRIDEALGGLAEVFLARPVLPRRFQLSVAYDF